jgi:hypothetical protein
VQFPRNVLKKEMPVCFLPIKKVDNATLKGDSGQIAIKSFV